MEQPSLNLLYGVVRGTILEPFEPSDYKKILSQIMQSDNINHILILLMKLDTQAYYNIRTIFGLGISYEGK